MIFNKLSVMNAQCLKIFAFVVSVTQQCLHVNRLQMIEKAQWPTNSPDLNVLEISSFHSDAKSICNAAPEAKNRLWHWRT